MKVSQRDLATWEAVLRYLDEALDMEPDAREPWLEQLAAVQPGVSQTVRELLRERERLTVGEFLDYAPLSSLGSETVLPALQEIMRADPGIDTHPSHIPAAASSGLIVGAYRLLREIGHGGMSCVWLAERCDGQPNRQIALKLPFIGHGRLLADHFKRECEILATLTHPNIARLYEAGVTAGGQPYLAMEYADGRPLTDYCDDNRLTVRQRLELFAQALATVEFAHEHLVLHRDLKPSNILVTAQVRIVLLDFGIAKVLSDDTAQQAPLTEVVGRILTPDYASPEHIAGKALSTASDVYSLGVVLFELLTGSRPFCSQHQSRRQLEEAILTLDPPPPSRITVTAELAAARTTTPRKLVHALRGDLDTILLKALKKSPVERYRTVDAFAKDISNHLANLPVTARPDSAAYRLHRFISRHRLPVTAAAITTVAIVGGSLAALYQARMAAQERDRAYVLASRNETISDFTETLISDAATSAQPMTVREMLARSEAVALADKSTNREDRAAILQMIGNRYHAIGDVGKALSLFDRALAVLEDSNDVELKSQVDCSRAFMLAEQGRSDAANEAFAREFNGSHPKPGVDAMFCLYYRAMVAQDLGDADAVVQYGLEALEQFRRDRRHAVENEATILGVIANGYMFRGQTAQANHYFGLALQKFVDSGRESTPNARNVEASMAVISLDAGLPKRALELYERMLGYSSADNANSAPASLVYSHARALQEVGRYQEAQAAYASAIDLALQQKALIPQVYSLLGLAMIAVQSQDAAVAAGYLRQALTAMGSSFPANSRPFLKVAEVRGRVALADRRLDEARKNFDLMIGNKSKSVTTIYGELELAELELAANNSVAAEADARSALEVATSLQDGGSYSNLAGLSWLMLGRALQLRGDTSAARIAFTSAVSHLSNTVDADHPALLQARRLLGTT
jgi:serine/threonine protein kinase/tetratricopeptide (TPR) repeat protein